MPVKECERGDWPDKALKLVSILSECTIYYLAINNRSNQICKVI